MEPQKLNIPSWRLSNEYQVPAIGLSVSREGIEPCFLNNLLKYAIKAGYRYEHFCKYYLNITFYSIFSN